MLRSYGRSLQVAGGIRGGGSFPSDTQPYRMQLSHYLKIYPFEERPGFVLAYSTKKGSVSLLNKESFHSIERGSPQPNDEKLLLELGIIAHDREAEKREVQSILKRLNENNTTLNITALLNLDCNFACTYCYEGEMKGRLYMTDETRGHLIDFVKARFKEKMKFLNIDFFGGEPLLSMNLIRSISGELKSFAQGKGASYMFTITTNGSLLKRGTAEELAGLGLTGVKTTLDGPAEIHDRCRPFRTGKGSFDVIIKNIRETCDIIKIGISGNFTKENYLHFPSLLDCLKNEGLTPDKIIQIKFDPVMPRFHDNAAPTDFVDGCMSINEPWVIDAGASLREEVLRRGYNTPKIQPMPCQVELDDYYVVNYDGAIYKCPALIGKKDFKIGNLRNGTVDYSDSHKLGIWKNKECVECEYLPLCFGGCRYMKLLRDGAIDGVDCKRPYLDAILETLIKQDIKYRVKTKNH